MTAQQAFDKEFVAVYVLSKTPIRQRVISVEPERRKRKTYFDQQVNDALHASKHYYASVLLSTRLSRAMN